MGRGIVSASDAPALVVGLQCRAFLLGYLGRWRQVARLCERRIGQLRLVGPYQLANTRFLRAEALYALGDLELARAQMLAALPDLEAMRPVCGVHLARVKIGLGDVEEAGQLVRGYVGGGG